MHFNKLRCICLYGVFIFSPLVFGESFSYQVTVKVTVQAPSCSINNGNSIEVNFGELMTTKVDGHSYRMPVNYNFSCSGNTSNLLLLQVKGTGAPFDSEILKTNVNGLGIELQVGRTKLPLNSRHSFREGGGIPQLWVVPVKQTGATLDGGTFTSAATMTINYL